MRTIIRSILFSILDNCYVVADPSNLSLIGVVVFLLTGCACVYSLGTGGGWLNAITTIVVINSLYNLACRMVVKEKIDWITVLGVALIYAVLWYSVLGAIPVLRLASIEIQILGQVLVLLNLLIWAILSVQALIGATLVLIFSTYP